jgi:hypothetical protein
MKKIHRITQRLVPGVLATLFAASAFAQYSTPVRDVENPARTPFASSGTVTVDPGFAGVFGTPIADVPANKRLVVEYVSVTCSTPAGNEPNQVSVGATLAVSGGGTITRSYQIPIQPQGDPASPTRFVGGLQTTLYADRQIGGGGVSGNVLRETGTGTTTCSFSLNGHLISI